MKSVQLKELISKEFGYNRLFRKEMPEIRHRINKVLLAIGFVLIFLTPHQGLAQVQIIKQPIDTAICSSADGAFMVVASNASHYHWQENDGISWTDLDNTVTYVSGVFSPTLEILDANTGLNNYLYRCKVSNSAGDYVITNSATLLVNDPPIIVEHPQNKRACRNSWVSFNVGASNATSYEWQENPGIGWISLENSAFCEGSDTDELNMYITTGMNGYRYRCLVYQGGCPIPSHSALLMADPIPITYYIQGGGVMCENSDGLNIGLSGSEEGIKYELHLNDIASGQVLDGTGNSLNFGLQNQAGSYTVKATNASTGCLTWMEETADIFIEALPIQYEVQGGGTVCQGSPGVEIKLSGSEISVQYTLYRDGSLTSVMASGTGYAISFGLQNEAGTYTVFAEKVSSSCSSIMTGEVDVIVNIPPIAIAGPDQVIEEGTVCQLSATAQGGSGNYSYNWIPENLIQGNGTQQYPTTVELYNSAMFFLSIKDVETSCISIKDTTIITVTDTPLSAFVTANPQTICKGESSTLIGLGSGGNGSYTYSWTSTPAGFTSNSSSVQVSPEFTTTYHLEVSAGLNQAFADVIIVVSELPLIYEITGGGAYCASDEGSFVGLNASQDGVVYELRNQVGNLVRMLYGTGSALNFGKIGDQGVFEVYAHMDGFDCEQKMEGQIEIYRNENPTVLAAEDITISYGEQATLSAHASGGSGAYAYSWSPEPLLEQNDIASPKTIALTQTAVFDVIAEDTETSCLSEKDLQIVYVADGPLSLEVSSSLEYVCPDMDFSVYALPSGGSGNYSCLWSSNPEGFVAANLSSIARINVDTWFIASVTDGTHTLKDSVLVKIRALPKSYEVIGGGEYCPVDEGVEIGLSNSELNVDYALYLNNQPTGLTLQGNQDALSYGKQSLDGTYTIIADPQAGCRTIMTGDVLIERKQEPQKFNLIGGGTWCENDPGASVLLSQSEEKVNYQLVLEGNIIGDELVGSGLPLHFSGINSSGNYSVRANHMETGCKSLMNNIVQVNLLPLPDLITIDDAVICKGEEIELYASGADGYSWGTQPPVGDAKIIVQPTESTTYIVMGTLNNGCSATKTITVEVMPIPEFSYFLDKNQKKILISPTDYMSYTYSHEDVLLYEGTSSEYYLGHLVGKLSQIHVQVQTESNCKSEELIEIGQMQDINAFSPNGDGINDIFMQGAYILVFDKWGVKIFEGDQGWNGEYGKKKITPGTYYFVEKIYDQNSQLVRTRKGSVTLVRN